MSSRPRMLSLGVAALLLPRALAAQSPVITITPGTGTYSPGTQVAVHVEFCITDANQHFWTDGVIKVNGVEVGWGAYFYVPGCVDSRAADATVTTGSTTTTVTASVQTYIGEPADDFPTTSTSVFYNPPPPPVVSIDVGPHNGYHRSAALCAMACFNAVATYTTPAYWTLDAARAVTLFYSSGQVQSRHTVQVNASFSCTTSAQVVASDAFAYDAAGNRTDKGALVDAANRLVRFNGDSMLYDPDGNLVRRFRIADSTVFNQRLFWNSVNQLDSARTTRGGATQTARFGYDGYGRRVRKTVGASTVRYVYSGSRVVAEFDGNGALLRRYTYLPGMDNPHAVYNGFVWQYFVSDARGNIHALLSASGGTIEATYRYTPFGDTLATAGFDELNNIRFAGREFDQETGLYYNRARYYDPKIARFLSEDTGDLSAVNRYTFAANDPVNGRDPSGRWCEVRQGGLQKQEAPPVVPGSSPTPSAATYDGEYLYCEDITAADLWYIEAYLRGPAFGLRTMWNCPGFVDT